MHLRNAMAEMQRSQKRGIIVFQFLGSRLCKGSLGNQQAQAESLVRE